MLKGSKSNYFVAALRTGTGLLLLAAVGTVQVLAIDLDLFEAEREQAAAAAAESQGSIRKFELPPPEKYLTGLPLGTVNPLFIGVDDVTISTFLVDPATANASPGFTGFQVWGAAYDSQTDRVYFNSGVTLHYWQVGGTVTTVGTVQDSGGNNISLVALAMFNGQLYGTRNIATEGVYTVDTTTAVAALQITYAAAHDMGGLAIDQTNGTIYATDDSLASGARSLVRINNDGSVTAIAPYPAGETDLDALAIGPDGRAYIVPDQPGSIYVYDLVGAAYLPPFANPWTTSETFSGATFIAAPSANATVSGQVVTPSGSTIGNVTVQISDGGSFERSVVANPFGYFSFSDVPTGVVYSVTGVSKNYSFTPQNVPVNGNIDDLILMPSLAK